MKISDEEPQSSDEEAVENPLAAFFHPGKGEKEKTNEEILAEGGITADGDLDSRLANIFTKKKEEAPELAPPPPRPAGINWSDTEGSSSSSTHGGKWDAPPGGGGGNPWERQQSPHFPHQQQRYPPPSPGGNFPPHRGGGRFNPRTPPPYHRLPPPGHQGFNSEGANRHRPYRPQFHARGNRGRW